MCISEFRIIFHQSTRAVTKFKTFPLKKKKGKKKGKNKEEGKRNKENFD